MFIVADLRLPLDSSRLSFVKLPTLHTNFSLTRHLFLQNELVTTFNVTTGGSGGIGLIRDGNY